MVRTKIPTRGLMAVADSAVCFVRSDIDKLIEQAEITESVLRQTNNVPLLTKDELTRFRQIIMFKLCAELPPAGNA